MVVVGGHDGVMALPLRIDMAVVHEIDQQVLPRRFGRETVQLLFRAGNDVFGFG